MGLAEDLLIQARHLANLDAKRPKQANLRRAISASYYALFHLLIADAALRFIPKNPTGLIPRVSRAFSHQEMKSACATFTRLPLPDPLKSLLGLAPSPALRSIASTFIELQEARHSADYDTGVTFSRAATLAIISKADLAFRSWQTVESTDEASVFLAALAFGARWSK